MSLKKNQTTKIKGIIMIEIYNQIKDNKLSVKQAADLFVKMHPETLKSAMRKFCIKNNLESPFQKRGRPELQTQKTDKSLQEIYDIIKKNKLTAKDAAQLFYKNLNPRSFQTKITKFCIKNNLESPLTPGRPKIALVLKSDINQLIEENKNKE